MNDSTPPDFSVGQSHSGSDRTDQSTSTIDQRLRFLRNQKSTAPHAKLEFEETVIERPGEDARNLSRGAKRLNKWTGYIVIFIVILAAVPGGSNFPVPWMFWSGILFLLHAAHIVLMTFVSPRRPVRLARDRQWIIPAIGLAFSAWLAIQAAPLPDALSGLLTLQFDWGAIETSSISLTPAATLMGLIRVLGYVSLFTLTLEISTRGSRVDRFGWLLVLGIMLHAVWGLIALRFLGDISLWGEKTAYKGFVTGTFVNRNSFATFMGMGVLLGLALVLDRVNVPRVRKARSIAAPRVSLEELVFLSISIAIIFLALIGTQSRMGVASTTFAAIIVYGTMRIASGKAALRATSEALLLGAAATGVALVAYGPSFLERFLFLAGTSNDRFALWDQTIQMISDRPFLGYGWDSFATAFPLFHRAPLSPALTWEFPHSTYLTLWVEAGVIFGSLPLIAVGVIVWRLIKNMRALQSHHAVPIAAFGICIQIGIHSLVDFSMEMHANMLLFVVIVAMGSAARRGRA